MIPFDGAAPDLHRREEEIGDELARAVAASGVPRVVRLSGLSAHLSPETIGSARGAAMMEQRLNAMDIGELVNVTFALVSRAPLANIEKYRTRMGWTLPWYSSADNDFNGDFGRTTASHQSNLTKS